MSKYRYAQLNPETKRCFAVSFLKDLVTDKNAILLEDDKLNPIDLVYKNGKWIKQEIAPQPTQLDRIESAINKTQEQIAQEARDAYTLELIEGGVIQ